MDNKISLCLILGTAREGRKSEFVYNFIKELLQKDLRIDLKLIDVKNYEIKFDGDKAQKLESLNPSSADILNYHEAINSSDGLIFVFPEYNHSYPGQLKSLIDSEYDVYKNKTVALASVSNGQFGGARALTLLIPVVTYLGMIDSGIHMHFPNVENLFDENGKIKDEPTVERTSKYLEKLISITTKLNRKTNV
jgi:NAD(P)H-dependent FMN reductase